MLGLMSGLSLSNYVFIIITMHTGPQQSCARNGQIVSKYIFVTVLHIYQQNTCLNLKSERQICLYLWQCIRYNVIMEHFRNQLSDTNNKLQAKDSPIQKSSLEYHHGYIIAMLTVLFKPFGVAQNPSSRRTSYHKSVKNLLKWCNEAGTGTHN